jgi:ABC-type nitrate/sulfonate/bicarbonate transport system ATPase subunit
MHPGASSNASVGPGLAEAIPDVELVNVTLTFPAPRTGNPEPVYENFNLAVERGSFTVILGPSGCGKSTLLNVVDGLIVPSDAEAIRVMGQDIRSNPDQTRQLAYVFQNARLLPWKTLRGNAEFGLRGLRIQPEERWDELIAKYFGMVGLEQYLDYYPHQVSGGMQQRAAIVRAWVNEPRVLLMDEPFSHLDEITAASLRRELTQLWMRDEERRTVIFVTHDINEAVQVGTRIVMLTQRPAVIAHDEAIELPYPRDPDDDELFEAEKRLRLIFSQRSSSPAR